MAELTGLPHTAEAPRHWPAPPPHPRTRPDVLLVVVDALRADRVNDAGPSPTRPSGLARLARSSVTFLKAFSHAPETQTAVPALLTGRFPPGQIWEQLPSDHLGAMLRKHGYRTAGFSGNSWLSADRGYRVGFSRFTSLDYHYPASPKAAPPRQDGRQLVQAALSFWRQPGRPAFVYVHLMDVHYPYAPPAAFLASHANRSAGRDRYTNGTLPLDTTAEDMASMRSRYDASVQYVTQLLTPLLDLASRRDALVILTADHGEALGEQMRWGHGVDLEPDQLHVPLIIHFPGQRKPVSVLRTVAHWDIAPTVLAAAGIPVGARDGRDLGGFALNRQSSFTPAKDSPDRPLFAALRQPQSGETICSQLQDPWRLVGTLTNPNPRAYLGDAHGLESAWKAPLPLELKWPQACAQQLRSRGNRQSPTRLDAATRSKLSALGYVGDPP